MQAISIDKQVEIPRPKKIVLKTSDTSNQKYSKSNSNKIKKLIETERSRSSESGSGEEDEYFEDRQEVFDGKQNQPSEFTNHHVIVKAKEKSLKPSLKKAGFCEDIINKANEIFSEMETGLKRNTRHRQLMFYCVSKAYDAFGIPQDPAKIASQCGISISEISKANSMCSPSKTKFKAPSVNWSPIDFIDGYFEKLVELEIIRYSEEAIEDIKNICNEVMSKSIDLRQYKPQIISAAVVIYYLSMHNYVLEKKRYQEIFSRSEMTLQKMKNQIAVIYNS
jgi:hypothetical protein